MLELKALEKTEASRTYTFPSGVVTLKGVTHFLARESGTHRLRTSDGKLHIVPVGWMHIEIEAEAFSL